MQWPAGGDARVFRPQFLAQIQPLLAIGPARGELAAEREPTAPRPAAPHHRDPRLFGFRQVEKGMADPLDFGEQRRGDAVPGKVEEAGVGRRPVDRGRRHAA